MARALDLRLYVVTDREQAGERGVAHVVRAAIEGGATIIQLRDKRAGTRELVEQARALVALCRPHRVPLLVNDRVDVALAAGADGVHLGQSDMDLSDARRLMGDEAIIGVSVRDAREVTLAERHGASYVAANGVWATATKTDFGLPLGEAGLEKLVACCRLPMVAIGGITVREAPHLAAAGCAGIAVVSAVMKAPEPRDAARALREAFGR
ncbi:MAG: thiamine phosphate synthase [Myxococcota bacterium]